MAHCVHWLDVADRIRFSLCAQVFKCQHSMARGYLAELCRPVSSIDGHRHLYDLLAVTSLTFHELDWLSNTPVIHVIHPCDRQTDWLTDGRAIAYSTLCIASRGKNVSFHNACESTIPCKIRKQCFFTWTLKCLHITASKTAMKS